MYVLGEKKDLGSLGKSLFSGLRDVMGSAGGEAGGPSGGGPDGYLLGVGVGCCGQGPGAVSFPPPPPAWSSLLICEVGTFGVCEGGWESVVSVGWTRLPGWNVQAACRRRVLVLSRLPRGFAPCAQHWSHVSKGISNASHGHWDGLFFHLFIPLFVRSLIHSAVERNQT